MNKKINYEPSTRRAGKFLLKLFLSFLLLKGFIFIYRISDNSAFNGIDSSINLVVFATFITGLILYWPHVRTISSIKRFFENHALKEEEHYAKLLLNYLFQFMLVVYLVLFIASNFTNVGFNTVYFLVISVILGIFTIIFPAEKKSLIKKPAINI